MRTIFKICEWISSEEYAKVRSFAEYLGRRNGCSIFAFKHASLNSSRLDEYVSLLEKLGAEITEGRNELYKMLESLNTVNVRTFEEGFLLSSRRMLSDMLAEYRAAGLVRYSRRLRGFIVKPYAILDVLDELKSRGLVVRDDTCLIECERKLHVNFQASLRPYQEEALKSWVKNRYRGIIALPTGAGKTIVALAAIATISLPTLIIVYTQEQLREWSEKVKSFLGLNDVSIGKLYAGEKKIMDLTIATYQSAIRWIDSISKRFSLLIVDEAHHLPADKFRTIALRVLSPYRLGLSATPYREDGRHVELFQLMGGIVYEKSFEELERMGYVASFTVKPVLVSLSGEEEEKYRALQSRYNVLSRGRSVQELVNAASKGDEAARKALQVLSDMRMLLALSEQKIREAEKLVREELAKGSKIIVFTQYVKQAEHLGRRLGIPVVTGRTDKHRRSLVFELFKRGRYRAIILTTVGDEGIDIPDADTGIILSGTSSKRQFIQRLGRLLRPSKGKRAKLYYIAVKDSQEERTLRKLLRELNSY